MIVTIEAIYENGILRPQTPLTLAEGARVEITVATIAERHKQLVDALDEIANLPIEGPSDNFSGGQHDLVLYGWQDKQP